jgi:hypothetical protein
MSFEAMAWAVKQRTENSGQKLVLLLLANHTNGHTGQCNPSHKLLADECNMGLSTLKGHLQSLSSIGLIQIIHKYQDGVALPNQYQLIFDGVGQNLTDGRSETDRRVGQNLATKQEDKPVKEPIYKPDDVSQEVWDEFLSSRKKLKAELTGLAMKRIASEAKIAGWTLQDALEEICVRGWRSFKAEWVAPKQTFAQQKMDEAKMSYNKLRLL